MYTIIVAIRKSQYFLFKVFKFWQSFYYIYVTLLRSGEDPELRNTLKNASY